MTRDEVFKLAEKAGFECCWEDTDLECGLIWWSDECPLDEKLLRFAALVAASEREACAELADKTVCDTHIPTGVNIYGTRAAKAIRARSEK
jgi:hypothetical protein